VLDAEVVVQMAGDVLVDAEEKRRALASAPRLGLADGRCRQLREVPLVLGVE